MDAKTKRNKTKVRAQRVRAKIRNTKNTLPRLSVYKSNTRIIAQIIDDLKAETILYITSNDKAVKGTTPTEKAKSAGEILAKLAKDKGIEEVVFDRGGFMFTGKVKALADGAREGGLKF
jgi:large subunit ribosomal protein L18